MGHDDFGGEVSFVQELDKRVHARINLSAEVDVSGPGGLTRATLKNLSKGGARLLVPRVIAEMGDTVEMFLPVASGSEICVMGEVVRADVEGDGQVLALRFSLVEPSSRKALDDLLETLLTGKGGGRRKHARIAKRIAVRYGNAAQLRAVVEDVSKGGLSMTVADTLVLDEEVVVVIPDGVGEELLTMKAKVVSLRTLQGPSARAFRVGLSFGELRPERRRCLEALVDALADASASRRPVAR